jgi:hypothetical protein
MAPMAINADVVVSGVAPLQADLTEGAQRHFCLDLPMDMRTRQPPGACVLTMPAFTMMLAMFVMV